MKTVWSWSREMRRSRSARKTGLLLRGWGCCALAAAILFSAPLPGFAEGMESHGSTAFETGMNKSIFLDLRDINVIDVFKFLAVQGSLNIVTSKNVQGRSTLLLRDVKIKDALDILVVSNQLAYETRNDILYIMTEDEYATTHGKNFNDKKKIAIRTLKTSKPSYVMATLQGVQSGIGKVIIDEDTGTVVMIDIPEKLMQMNGILDQVEKNLETKVIKLQFAKAEDVAAQLKPQIEGKGVGTVIPDSRSNQIVLSAYPDRLDNAVKLVVALDRQNKAVLVECRILQLTLNPKFEFGIDWNKTFPVDGKDFKVGSFFPNTGIPDEAAAITPSFGKLSFGQAGDNFYIKIKAMKEIESTKTLANPRLMILDRQEAKINIGDRIPYIVSTTTANSGGGYGISSDVRFIDVGIVLAVTPTINDDGFVTMKLRPEISSQTGSVSAPASTDNPDIKNEIPKVNTTYIESTVILRDGVSAILGGLIRDDQTQGNKGVPYLMDIPLLGHLFKMRSETIKKTEIVIIITPHIVNGEGDVLDKPIQIKGKSTGNIREASFQESKLDLFRTHTFDASSQEEKAADPAVDRAAEKTASGMMPRSVSGLPQELSPKRGK